MRVIFCICRFSITLRKKYDADISKYKQSKELTKNIQDAEKEIRDLQDQINSQNLIIRDNQQKTRNVDIAIGRINDRLKSFGLEGFQINKAASDSKDGHLYEIARGDDGNGVFQTLSEGEKTLITFLYFIETCLGVDSAEKAASVGNRIIVIDDPISSLSFNLVFDIATLIKSYFLKSDTPYKQIIILTHHLYFFHELHKSTGISNNDLKFYRVVKCNKTSIEDLRTEDIMNNYECYWQIIKDVKSGKISSVILPNAMRNILEHYFSFVRRKHKLADAFKELLKTGDLSINSFNRYVNRSSHSDGDTLTDTQDIDVNKFIAHFRSIFEKTEFLEHYEEMMSDKNTSKTIVEPRVRTI
jgi:wobble nucleotide-excising tRNase